MVVCKYFQQGSCKFGQYCRFEHISGLGGNQSAKPYGESKNIVLGVAEEILTAERGGQWPLSCFGPFKEQPCIPGMEDISPEEVRWEMYQAQKSGTVEQTKLQFQQLCDDMKAKREALKNPTHETAALLEKLQKGNRDTNPFSTKSNFSLSSSSNSVFGTKTFSTTNSFIGNGFNSTGNTPIFGRSATNTSTVFGGKPSFGGTPIFGGQPAANSIFGDASKTTSSIFGGAQNMPTFVSAAQSSSFNFGNTNNSPSIFNQSNHIFSSSQPTTSVFGSNTTTTLPFSNSTQQSTAPPFGITSQNVPSLFGTAPIQASTPIFGGSQANSSSSILRPPQTTVAFGGAPVFNATSIFGATTAAPTFGGQPTFNTPRSIFGTNTTNTTFGSNVQPVNSFSALSTAPSIFTSTQNSNSPFGAISSAPNTGTFGTNSTQSGSVFGNVFATAAAQATASFSQPSTFGSSTTSNVGTNAFGVPNTSNTFLHANNPVQSNETPPSFGSGGGNNPFASTTVTSTVSNPFALLSQQNTVCTNSSATPGFGGINFACKVAEKIDESIYTLDDQLTDNEKQMYLSDQFILGKIPLKPPSIELR